MELDCSHYQNLKFDQYPATVATHDHFIDLLRSNPKLILLSLLLVWNGLTFFFFRRNIRQGRNWRILFACYRISGKADSAIVLLCCWSYHWRHFEFAEIFLLHFFIQFKVISNSSMWVVGTSNIMIETILHNAIDLQQISHM